MKLKTVKQYRNTIKPKAEPLKITIKLVSFSQAGQETEETITNIRNYKRALITDPVSIKRLQRNNMKHVMLTNLTEMK